MKKQEKELNDLEEVMKGYDISIKKQGYFEMIEKRLKEVWTQRENFTEEQAKDIFEQINKILNKFYKMPLFDIDRISTNALTSQRSKIIMVRETISRLEGKMGKLIPIEEIQKEIGKKMDKEEIKDSIQKLKQTGDIFEPRAGFIQRV